LPYIAVKFSQSITGGYPHPLIFTRRTASSVKFSPGGGVTADIAVGLVVDNETVEEKFPSCINVEFLAWYGAVEYMT
jgi:hypothetical protein